MTNVSTTTPVLAVVSDIARGDTITVADLGALEVADSAASHYLPVSAQTSIVGQTALVDLAAFTPLTEASAGNLQPGSGESLVGIPLTPGQLPSHGVESGAAVTLIATASVDATVADAAPLTITAEVFAIRYDDITGTYFVDLTLDATQAARVASLASTGNIALIVEGQE